MCGARGREFTQSSSGPRRVAVRGLDVVLTLCTPHPSSINESRSRLLDPGSARCSETAPAVTRGLTLQPFAASSPTGATPDGGGEQRSLRQFVVPLLLFGRPHFLPAANDARERLIFVVKRGRRIRIVGNLLRRIRQHGPRRNLEFVELCRRALRGTNISRSVRLFALAFTLLRFASRRLHHAKRHEPSGLCHSRVSTSARTATCDKLRMLHLLSRMHGRPATARWLPNDVN